MGIMTMPVPGSGGTSTVTRIVVRVRNSRATPDGWQTVELQAEADVVDPARWEAEALRIREELELLAGTHPWFPGSNGHGRVEIALPGEPPAEPTNGRQKAICAFWNLAYDVNGAGRKGPDALTQEEGREFLEAAGGDFVRARRLLEDLLEAAGGSRRRALERLRAQVAREVERNEEERACRTSG